VQGIKINSQSAAVWAAAKSKWNKSSKISVTARNNLSMLDRISLLRAALGGARCLWQCSSATGGGALQFTHSCQRDMVVDSPAKRIWIWRAKRTEKRTRHEARWDETSGAGRNVLMQLPPLCACGCVSVCICVCACICVCVRTHAVAAL